MNLISLLIGCTSNSIYTYPVTMSPQKMLTQSTEQSDSEQSQLVPFPIETAPDEVMQDNTTWFADISLLNATAQSEKEDIQVTWLETPDLSTKFLMLKIQRAKELSWAELAGHYR